MMSTTLLPNGENFGRKRSDSMVFLVAPVCSDVEEPMKIGTEAARAAEDFRVRAGTGTKQNSSSVAHG